MRGRIVCVGVGPGDPELMTLKAVRLIREADVIAAPGDPVSGTVAFRIARGAVPEIADREHLGIVMPMSRDPEVQKEAHRNGVGKIEAVLDQGKQIVFLTLGDPSIYSTFPLLKRMLDADGYETSFVSGVPSFCAAAALLGEPLVQKGEPLYILPDPDGLEELLHSGGPGTDSETSLKNCQPERPDFRKPADDRRRYPEADIATGRPENGSGTQSSAPDPGAGYPEVEASSAPRTPADGRSRYPEADIATGRPESRSGTQSSAPDHGAGCPEVEASPAPRTPADGRNRYPGADIATGRPENGSGTQSSALDHGAGYPDDATLPDATVVLMKSGRHLAGTGALPDPLYDVRMVENCGMENEKVFRNVKDFPEKTGYFSLLIGRIRRSITIQ